MDARPEFAEALGVFLLVTLGCGALVAEATLHVFGPLGVALAFAFVILVLVYALGHVSGAHFNPAITLAFALSGHFPWRRVPGYVVAQAAGAIAGAFLVRELLGSAAAVGATLPLPGLGLGRVFVIEAVATFLLAFVIIAVATDKRSVSGASGLAIGLAVGAGALFAGPFTGGSMNPARSLGPALAAGTTDGLWVYFAAPIVGAALGMFAYEALRPGGLSFTKRDALGATGPIPRLSRATTDPRASDPRVDARLDERSDEGSP